MSWPLVKIADVAEFIRNGLSINQSDSKEGLPITRIETIADREINLGRCGYAGLSRGEADEYLLKNGDILISHINSEKHLAKCAIFEFDGIDLIHGMNLLCLRPARGKVFPKYLFYCLSNDSFLRQIKKITKKSVNQASFTVPSFKELELPLPPLEEQKRIAAILDKADAIRRKRQQAIKLADDFLRSVFLEMFGDPVTNPKGWEVKTLGSHLNAIESGASPKCESRPAQSGEWGVLKLGAVSYCKYVPSENKAIFHDYEPNPNNEIKKGDFLFTRKNTHELVAASALVESTPSKMLMPDLIFRLQPKDSLNRFYLWALLTHSGMRKKVQSYASGAAGSMPNISKANLRAIEIPIPPIEEQDKFQDIYQNVSTTKHKLNSSMAHIESQFFSLSQKAFSGQL